MGDQIGEGSERGGDQQPVEKVNAIEASALGGERMQQEGGCKYEPEKTCAIDGGIDRILRPVERIKRQTGTDSSCYPGLPARKAARFSRLALLRKTLKLFFTVLDGRLVGGSHLSS